MPLAHTELLRLAHKAMLVVENAAQRFRQADNPSSIFLFKIYLQGLPRVLHPIKQICSRGQRAQRCLCTIFPELIGDPQWWTGALHVRDTHRLLMTAQRVAPLKPRTAPTQYGLTIFLLLAAQVRGGERHQLCLQQRAPPSRVSPCSAAGAELSSGGAYPKQHQHLHWRASTREMAHGRGRRRCERRVSRAHTAASGGCPGASGADSRGVHREATCVRR